MTQSPNLRRKGFTLVELLVAITIIIVLAGIVFTVTGTIRKSANRAVTICNMRQIGVAMISFTSDKGRFPGVNTDPVWDRSIIPYLGYTDTLPGTKASVIRASDAPALEPIARIFASPADKEGDLSVSYRRSYAIIPWTTNLKVGNTILGWKNLPPGDGVRYTMLDYPEKSAMIVQWFSDGKSVANQLGNGGHQHHDSGGPVDLIGDKNQLVLFTDGHVDGVPIKVTGKDFRDKYWPGKIENIN